MKELRNTKYFFNGDMAKLVGVEKAILLENICYWTLANQANGINFHDGRYWTFNSAEAFTKIFPFWSSDKVKRMLKDLESAGHLITSTYNKLKFDRTKWYSPSDEIIDIYNGNQENCTMHSAKLHNEKVQNCTMRKCEIAPPIPYINNIVNKDNIVQTGFEKFWSAYPKKQSRAMAEKAWNKLAPSSELIEIILAKIIQFRKTDQWTHDGGKYIPMPSTFLNQRRWEDSLDISEPPPPVQEPRKPRMSQDEMIAYMAAESARYDAELEQRKAESQERVAKLKEQWKSGTVQ